MASHCMLCLEKAQAVQKWFLWSLAGIILTIMQGTCCCMHARHALGTQVQEDMRFGSLFKPRNIQNWVGSIS